MRIDPRTTTVLPNTTPRENALLRLDAARQAVARMIESGEASGRDHTMAQANATRAVKELGTLVTKRRASQGKVASAIALATLATTLIDAARAAEKLGGDDAERKALERAAQVLAKAQRHVRASPRG